MRRRIKIQVERKHSDYPAINTLVCQINKITATLKEPEAVCVKRVKQDRYFCSNFVLIVYGYNLPHFRELFLSLFLRNVDPKDWEIIKY